jgi:hypothetical protein
MVTLRTSAIGASVLKSVYLWCALLLISKRSFSNVKSIRNVTILSTITPTGLSIKMVLIRRVALFVPSNDG